MYIRKDREVITETCEKNKIKKYFIFKSPSPLEHGSQLGLEGVGQRCYVSFQWPFSG
jgi:hypothetical protein